LGTCAGNGTYATLTNGNFVFDWAEVSSEGRFEEDAFWGSDGTTAGTQRLKFLFDVQCGLGWDVLADRAFIWQGCGANDTPVIWGTFGTRASTARLPIQNPGAGLRPNVCPPLRCRPLYVVVGHRIVFVADTLHLGRELWVSDGTPGGTSVLKDIRPGAASSWIQQLYSNGAQASFTADDGHGRAIWVSNGTAAGTHKRLT
jgi:ELWxxDGT repeat protein